MPSSTGGDIDYNCFVRYYFDDRLMVEVQWYPSGIRCLTASASLASDHFRLFGERTSRDPPLLSAREASSWDTLLEVLGWEIDTAAMTISLPSAKFAKIREFLREWPAEGLFSSEKEVRSFVGKLLRVCEVARAVKVFIHRMFNQLGLPPMKIWQHKYILTRVSRRRRLQLTPEFNADVEVWRLLLEGALGSPSGTLHAPLYIFCSQSYSRTLWSDASGNAMEEYCFRDWGVVESRFR